MKDCLSNKYKTINMISLDIKNRLFTYFARLVNILDFNSKILNIRKAGNGETLIYYIDYDRDPFYLVIDDLKGYFEENKDNKYLTIILKSQRQKIIYTKIWEEIKILLMKLMILKLVIIVKTMV